MTTNNKRGWFDFLVKTPIAYMLGFMFLAVGYYKWNQTSPLLMTVWMVSGLLLLPITKRYIISCMPLANSFRINVLVFVLLVVTIPIADKFVMAERFL